MKPIIYSLVSFFFTGQIVLAAQQGDTAQVNCNNTAQNFRVFEGANDNGSFVLVNSCAKLVYGEIPRYNGRPEVAAVRHFEAGQNYFVVIIDTGSHGTSA